jgi:hypothetical protein
MGGLAKPRAHATYALLGPGGPLVYFFLPGSFLFKNIHAQRILNQFEVRKVPKMSRYAKQGFTVLQSYNQNKGYRWKIPINQCKT